MGELTVKWRKRGATIVAIVIIIVMYYTIDLSSCVMRANSQYEEANKAAEEIHKAEKRTMDHVQKRKNTCVQRTINVKVTFMFWSKDIVLFSLSLWKLLNLCYGFNRITNTMCSFASAGNNAQNIACYYPEPDHYKFFFYFQKLNSRSKVTWQRNREKQKSILLLPVVSSLFKS